jgi:hypothetical protein
MSITKLTKVTLFGSNAEQNAALSGLQSLGCVHLISMREESKPVALTAPEWNESVAGALRHLIGAAQGDIRRSIRRVSTSMRSSKPHSKTRNSKGKQPIGESLCGSGSAS